ncbi:MAG TPA: M56 family metallopeptidase [Candidatus Flavonifractor intestinipullorum]|uniref:M56 family metallopeptidase n=1 Tax=Candidatus Flavonifractor intestinipullorum TaxID=2838587 RepID=A0A9D2MBN6_9FIRM|nr:M56 family metallopeptidase [Candidatus Flavonifractor intestinipullorum]
MEGMFFRVLTVSLTCSAVLLPLLLLAPRLQNRYAARTLYVLWLLLALRLAVPVDLSLPRAPVKVAAPDYVVSLPAAPAGEAEGSGAREPAIRDLPGADSPAAPAVPEARVRTVSLWELLTLVWAGGAVWLVVLRGSGYWFSRRALLHFSRPAGEALQEEARNLAASLGCRRTPPVRLHGALQTPMVLGLFRPVVLLPKEMGEEERQVALAHELCHVKRHDVAYKTLLLVTTTIHWFNPLVWWMSRAAGRNLELCCDDQVVQGRDAAFRRQYGALLLRTAAVKDGPALSTQFGGSGEQMRRRLKNLFSRKRNSALLVALVLLGALALGALVAWEDGTAGEPLSAGEALGALEESVRYEDGTLSFTLPAGEPPAAWNILVSGRARMGEDGFRSVHYLEGEDWQPGETYSVDLSEAALGLVELNLDVYLGEEEREIDLIPFVRAGWPVYENETYGFTLTLPPSWAGNYEVREDNEGGYYSLYDTELENLQLANLTVTGAEMEYAADWGWTLLGHGESWYVYLNYIQGDIGLDALAPSDPVRLGWEARMADLRAMGGGALAFRGDGDFPVAPVYVNETYGFTLTLPQSWADRYEAVVDHAAQRGVQIVDFYQTDRGNGDGQLFTLCVEETAEYEAQFGDERVDFLPANSLWLGEVGEYTVYLWFVSDVRFDLDDETIAYEYSQMLQDAEEFLAPSKFHRLEPEGGTASYVNEAHGFTLTLPESWARSGAVAETGPDSALFYDPALGEEAGAVATLGVWTAFPAAITGEPYLLEGSREGRYVYLEFRDPGGVDAPEYQTLYEDLQALPGQYLTGETETASGGEIQTWKDLARREQEEQDRILGWYQGVPPENPVLRTFSAEELAAAGYWPEEGVDAYTFYELPGAPGTREEFVTALYNQFVPAMADEVYNFTLLGVRAPCLFLEGKMWRLDMEGWGVWYSYDWDSFTVLESSEDRLVYSLEGYCNFSNVGDLPDRKTWYFTLERDPEFGLWRYADFRSESGLGLF